MKKVSIGMLLPSSSILPMGKDFEKGIRSGLEGVLNNSEWEIKLVPEFIAEGSKEKAESAINKLINYEQVDLIAGIISNKAMMGLAEKIEKVKVPIIINNLGEHVPDKVALNSGVYLNSCHLWQQIWSLGKWGVANKGKVGMFVSGIYDSGYSFSMMLQMGMHTADSASRMPFAIAPVHSVGALADVSSVFQHIETFSPDFIFATFCGEEATMFLKEYTERGLHKKIPLLGLPYLLQPFDSKGEEMTIYTTVSSNAAIDMTHLNGMGEIADNPFPNFGYETGRLIGEALSKQTGSIRENIADVSIESDRGKINLVSGNSGRESKVYLIKNTYNGKETRKEVIEELDTIQLDNEVLEEAMTRPSSGWYNPYMGI